jgi:hypothetical protein
MWLNFIVFVAFKEVNNSSVVSRFNLLSQLVGFREIYMVSELFL